MPHQPPSRSLLYSFWLSLSPSRSARSRCLTNPCPPASELFSPSSTVSLSISLVCLSSSFPPLSLFRDMTVSNPAGTTRSTVYLTKVKRNVLQAGLQAPALLCDVCSCGGRGSWGTGGGQPLRQEGLQADWRTSMELVCATCSGPFRRMSLFLSQSQLFDPLGHESSHLHGPLLQVEECGEVGREAGGQPTSATCTTVWPPTPEPWFTLREWPWR